MVQVTTDPVNRKSYFQNLARSRSMYVLDFLPVSVRQEELHEFECNAKKTMEEASRIFANLMHERSVWLRSRSS